MEIVEGTEGYWNYHIAESGESKALCGAQVMRCGTERWESPSRNVRDSYCQECESKYMRWRRGESGESQFAKVWEWIQNFVAV